MFIQKKLIPHVYASCSPEQHISSSFWEKGACVPPMAMLKGSWVSMLSNTGWPCTICHASRTVAW